MIIYWEDPKTPVPSWTEKRKLQSTARWCQQQRTTDHTTQKLRIPEIGINLFDLKSPRNLRKLYSDIGHRPRFTRTQKPYSVSRPSRIWPGTENQLTTSRWQSSLSEKRLSHNSSADLSLNPGRDPPPPIPQNVGQDLWRTLLTTVMLQDYQSRWERPSSKQRGPNVDDLKELITKTTQCSSLERWTQKVKTNWGNTLRQNARRTVLSWHSYQVLFRRLRYFEILTEIPKGPSNIIICKHLTSYARSFERQYTVHYRYTATSKDTHRETYSILIVTALQGSMKSLVIITAQPKAPIRTYRVTIWCSFLNNCRTAPRDTGPGI